MSSLLEKLQSKMEVLFPLSIALFAALLSINDLFSNRFGSDELEMSNNRNNAYQWYQSKGIKETMLEGQLELLQSLLLSGTISVEKVSAIEKLVKDSEARIDRYSREKKELLVGSKSLTKDQWAQDIDGTLGKIVGAKEYDSFLQDLGNAGDLFDFASMLLQISLVVGAIGIILDRDNMKWKFLCLTILSGTTGTLVFARALWLANQIPY